jgi:hypothetical protein
MLLTETGPARSAIAVTKSDATVIQNTRALYVGGTGDLTVRMADGNTAVLVAVPAGALLPISVDMVLSTGTTATSIVALR